MSETPNQAAPPSPAARNNWGWVAFFAFVIVASIAAASSLIWFNRSIQLTPEALEEARHLWANKGPKNYNMIVTQTVNLEQKSTIFGVKVRGGKVTEVTMNGKLLERNDEQVADPLQFHSMERLFADAERFMNMDTKPGARRVFVTAKFDEDTGAIRQYIRRVMGTTERVERRIELMEVPPEKR